MSTDENTRLFDKRKLFPAFLTEAVPYIQRFRGKIILVKFGGAAMNTPESIRDFALDILLMALVGIRPVVVHGGGPKINSMMNRLGMVPEFREGFRVTDKETIDIVDMVLNALNKEIVAYIGSLGGRAVGISGKDARLVRAVRHQATVADSGETVDIGFVGEVAEVRPEVIEVLEKADFIPIIAPLGYGDDGQTYNINADIVAGEIAASLHAEKLILLTDAPGILRDREDPGSLINTVRTSDLDRLRSDGIIDGGMLPKVAACRRALEGGVGKAHIIDGRVPHGLILEVFTDEGIGTQVVRDYSKQD